MIEKKNLDTVFGIAFSRKIQWYKQKLNSVIFTKYIFIAFVKKKKGIMEI